jgi:hypothetical protein
MKKILPVFILLLSAISVTYGQCDMPVVLTASTTEYLNADSTVERSVQENAVVRFDKTSISVSSEHDKTMRGIIHSATCDWRIPYKEGKMVLETTFTDGSDSKAVTITIIGSGGKVTLLWHMRSKDRLIRVVADTFEEQRN